jgi:O-antigen ligase
LAAAAGLAGLPAGGRGRAGVVAAVAIVLVLGAGTAAGGGLARIRADRLSFTEQERSHAGTAALRIVERHPLVGVGPRQARLAWPTPYGRPLVARYAHDEYLQVLAELGAVGLVLLVGLIATIARQLWRAREWAPSPGVWAGIVAGLVAAVVHGGFDFLWHVPAVVLVCAALAGVAGTREAATTVATQRYRRAPLREQQPEGSVMT